MEQGQDLFKWYNDHLLKEAEIKEVIIIAIVACVDMCDDVISADH